MPHPSISANAAQESLDSTAIDSRAKSSTAHSTTLESSPNPNPLPESAALDSATSNPTTPESGSIDLSDFSPTRAHTQILPSSLCEKFGAVVFGIDETRLHIALAHDHPPKAKAMLAHHLESRHLESHHLDSSARSSGRELCFYDERSYCFFWLLRGMRFIEHFYTLHDVESRLHYILQEAIALESSDIHIECKSHHAHIRLRIDGSLREIGRIEQEDFAKLATKIKLDSKLDITEVRLPQDGRMHKSFGGKEYDFRVSCVPLFQGESIVCRILYKHERKIALDTLGLCAKSLRDLRESIMRKSGLILVVGPTGSGKSTTLYALLEELKTSAKKLITIEDPIEYQIPIATQIQLNPEIGFSFYEALKSVLRQDPDIIMVGEIRDRQTLELALNASLTGHLVLASLHSHDCIASLERLFEMGAARSVLATSLLCVVAQRLVGRLCEQCKQQVSERESSALGLVQAYMARGCDCCQSSGIKGRLVISQSLFIDEPLRLLLSGDGGGQMDWRTHLRSQLANANLPTLKADAMEKWESIDYRELGSLEH